MKPSTAPETQSLRCLCTSVGNDGFVAVHAALKAYYGDSITIIGCDVRADAYGLYLADKGYVLPRREDPAFAETLLDIVAQEHCSIIYPLSTFDQEYFAEHVGFYERKGLTVVASDLRSVAIANDKLKLYELCQRAGIPVAAFVPLREPSSLEIGLNALGYPERPVVFKLARGTGARGLALVQQGETIFASLHNSDGPPRMSPEELGHALAYMKERTGVLCEYLPGDEYSIDVLSMAGEPIVSVVRKRYASLGGLALHAEVIEDAEVRCLAEAVVRELGLSYTSNVQVRRDVYGAACLMEVNPRIPGTIGLTVQAGVNMPALGLELAQGRKVPNRFSVEYGMRVMRYWGGYYHHGPLLNGHPGSQS
jgi:carbamoyl-phosphate synthase large subunit